MTNLDARTLLPETRCTDDGAHAEHEWSSTFRLWWCPGRRVSRQARMDLVVLGQPDPEAGRS